MHLFLTYACFLKDPRAPRPSLKYVLIFKVRLLFGCAYFSVHTVYSISVI